MTRTASHEAGPAPAHQEEKRMGLRDRRDNRREERDTFGRRGSAHRYQMRQRMLSIGDDYWIEDEAGDRAFRVDGKALRLRNTLNLEDTEGNRICQIQTRVLHIRDSMAIEDPDGGQLALVHKALISPLRERWKVDLAGDREWTVQGNIVDHEYEIEDDGHKIAEVSKKWFRMRDTYGVEIAPGQNVTLVLAVTVAIDTMAHPRK
jgi:uncharacterized protein YxjI